MARRSSRRGTSYTALSITSMMDMMTIILVFLLKHFGVDEAGVVPSADLKIPVSSSVAAPQAAVQVVVSTRSLLVDGVEVAQLEESRDEQGRAVLRIPEAQRQGRLVPALRDVLLHKRNEALAVATPDGASAFDGEVLLQADRRLPFDVVRQVMHTASEAQFSTFRFVVLKGGE